MEFTQTTFALGPKHHHHYFRQTHPASPPPPDSLQLTSVEDFNLEHVHKDLLRKVYHLNPSEAPEKWRQLVDLTTPYDLLTEKGQTRFARERGGAAGDSGKVYCHRDTKSINNIERKVDLFLYKRTKAKELSEKLYRGLCDIANWDRNGECDDDD